MARNTTPALPKPAEAEIHHPPPTTGGAFKRLPNGDLAPIERATPTPPPAPPAEQPSE